MSNNWSTLIPNYTWPQQDSAVTPELDLSEEPIRRRIYGINLQPPGRDLGSIIRSLALTPAVSGRGNATLIPTLNLRELYRRRLLQYLLQRPPSI